MAEKYDARDYSPLPQNTSTSQNYGNISNAFNVAGAVSSVMGAYYSAQFQKADLKYQEEMAGINANIAEIGAKAVIRRGQRAEQKSRLDTAQLKSAQRARLAANGVDLGSVSSLAILTSTDLLGEIDANTIAGNTLIEATNARAGVASQNIRASQAGTAASTISPAMSGFSTLLGAGGQVANRWYQMNKVGAV